jgi:predicted O-methyltransferase YrrM
MWQELADLLHRQFRWTRAFSKNEIARRAHKWAKQPTADLVEKVKPRSMLHQETLTLLHFFASRCRGAIVEIGPYTGGATVLMAKAMKDARRHAPLLAIEMGGAHEHDELPTGDILGDLRNVLREHGVADRVTVIEGHSGDDHIVRKVGECLGEHKIGLLVLDADGCVERDFKNYRAFLARRAVIMCDDYLLYDGASSSAPEKQTIIQTWVDEAIRSGLLGDLGAYKWGTWFGQLPS